MRSYQINITVHSPLTLRRPGEPDDREVMFRYLNDLLGEVSIDVGAFARARLEQARQAAAEAGYVLDIPALAEPMGIGHGFHGCYRAHRAAVAGEQPKRRTRRCT